MAAIRLLIGSPALACCGWSMIRKWTPVLRIMLKQIAKPRSQALARRQPLLQIGDQIGLILKPDRKPHDVVAGAC